MKKGWKISAAVLSALICVWSAVPGTVFAAENSSGQTGSAALSRQAEAQIPYSQTASAQRVQDVQKDRAAQDSDGTLANELASDTGVRANSVVQLSQDTQTDETPQEHAAFLNGFTDSTVRPNDFVSRAQAAQMLYKAAGGASGKVWSVAGTAGKSFSDVPAGAWYAEAVEALSAVGVFEGGSDGLFGPERDITRAEFASVLTRFNNKVKEGSQSGAAAGGSQSAPKTFSDVTWGSWYYDAVSEAAENGWITGYADGTFKPQSDASRAEAVTMINRLLGRSADKATVTTSFDIRIMPDVKSDYWAYYDLIEAMTQHTAVGKSWGEQWDSHEPGVVALGKGWHNINGELFYVDENSCFLYSDTVNGLELDSNGRYTTGDSELDALLTQAAVSAVSSEMTQEQKLRAMYDYAKETFSYRGATDYETGSTGWEAEAAKAMLLSGKGNCYSWAGAFTYLARKVGYPANAIAGESISESGNQSRHAWVEISFDGVDYTFDPQIESVYAKNYGINYDLYRKAYGTTPITYLKPEAQEPGDEDPGETEQADEKLVKILDIIYEGIEGPAVSRAPVNKSNEKSYLGVEGLDYRSGVASEAKIMSIAHSVVLIEMNEGADIESAKTQIKQNADGRKWICVGVEDEDIRVVNVGNYVLLAMDDDSELYIENFEKNAERILAIEA